MVSAQPGWQKFIMPSDTTSELSPLIGSWRLLSAIQTFTDTKTKEQAEPWGPNPDGRMIFDPGGQSMSCSRGAVAFLQTPTLSG